MEPDNSFVACYWFISRDRWNQCPPSHSYCKIHCNIILHDHLCGLVVRVSDYRSRDTGFDSRRFQIFWEVMGLERGPLSLVRITEELLEFKFSGSGSRKSSGDPLRWPRDTLYPQKLAVTLPTCGSRSIGIVRLRSKATRSLSSLVTPTRSVHKTARPAHPLPFDSPHSPRLVM
jgi:hypothetical protein